MHRFCLFKSPSTLASADVVVEDDVVENDVVALDEARVAIDNNVALPEDDDDEGDACMCCYLIIWGLGGVYTLKSIL